MPLLLALIMVCKLDMSSPLLSPPSNRANLFDPFAAARWFSGLLGQMEAQSQPPYFLQIAGLKSTLPTSRSHTASTMRRAMSPALAQPSSTFLQGIMAYTGTARRAPFVR